MTPRGSDCSLSRIVPPFDPISQALRGERWGRIWGVEPLWRGNPALGAAILACLTSLNRPASPLPVGPGFLLNCHLRHRNESARKLLEPLKCGLLWPPHRLAPPAPRKPRRTLCGGGLGTDQMLVR